MATSPSPNGPFTLVTEKAAIEVFGGYDYDNDDVDDDDDSDDVHDDYDNTIASFAPTTLSV